MRRTFLSAAALTAAVLMATGVSVQVSEPAVAAVPANEISRDANTALNNLTATNKLAKEIAGKAKAVLVFPEIVKGGFIFGGSFGKGALLQGKAVTDYYQSVSGSWGLQAGLQSYSYAVFLMNDKALKYLRDSDGWEIGVGPTVVIVDAGVAANLSSTTLQDDAYAFIFGQEGLMAGLTLEGSKVSRITPEEAGKSG
jgi:lipid-binding SYLF domain-containing protein